MRTPVPRFRRDWHDALGMLDSVHEEVGLMQFRHGTGRWANVVGHNWEVAGIGETARMEMTRIAIRLRLWLRPFVGLRPPAAAARWRTVAGRRRRPLRPMRSGAHSRACPS